MVGRPWSKKSHCHAWKPPWPPAKWLRIQPENGPPSTPDNGMADMKSDNTPPRRTDGNHSVR